MRERRDQLAFNLGSRQLAGDDVPEREINYARGFADAYVWILSHPERLLEQLEREIRREYESALQEEERISQEDSPYL